MPTQQQRTHLHLIEDFAHGGAQTQLRLLAKKAQLSCDTVHVASLQSAINTSLANSLREVGVSVHSIGRRFRIDPLASIQLSKLIRKVRPHAVQTWDSSSATTMLSIRRLGVSTRWCHTIRELDNDSKCEATNYKLACSADRVIVTSQPIYDWLAKLGVTEEKLKLAPNCWDPSGEKIDQATARGTLGLSHDAKVIVMAIRMDSAKRTKEAVWAADLVRILHPTVCLYVIGDGPARMACERFADKATAPGAIQFLGHREDLPTWISAANVVWCPSDSVGLSTPMLEAMSAARPTVVAKEPGREFLVSGGHTSRPIESVVDWNDRAGWTSATDQLLNDAELAEQIGSAARSEISEFSVEQVAKIHRASLFDDLSDPCHSVSSNDVSGNDVPNHFELNYSEPHQSDRLP